MTNSDVLPLAGFALAKVYAGELSFKGVPSNSAAAVAEATISFGWDWSFRSATEFDVSVSLRVEPSTQRPEEVFASLTGIFRKEGQTSVPLQRFAQLHAPAILMPFVREAVSSLTSRGLGGAYIFPPVNVLAMMTTLDAKDTTGARQIRDGHEFAQAFAEDVAVSTPA
jgi:preprotein translocase subunit SecB